MSRVERAWQVVLAARAHIRAGGNLHTKGSGGFPAQLRVALSWLDATVPVTRTSPAAAAARGERTAIEHVLPWKRIATEIIDPTKADPRSNTVFTPIEDGPARDPEHMIDLAKRLIVKARVTEAEHSRLNNISRSMQWDAPNGDGMERYRRAGIELVVIPAARKS